jgi:DNA-binding CsgD family transcriptional regulator
VTEVSMPGDRRAIGSATLAGVEGAAGRVSDVLVGRDRELRAIASFVERAAARGEALLLFGDPGVGKTALLEAAAMAASNAGCLNLRVAGVEFEAEAPFRGLHQALLPLRDQFSQLDRTHREALDVALGFGEGRPPDRLVICTAAIMVIRAAARIRPLMMIVDDLPWVDRASAGVLGFVARRLAGTRAGFIAASRTGEQSFFERAGLPEFELRPLDHAAAGELMRARFPALAPAVQSRLLAEAEGNPLALLELPAALTELQRAGLDALPSVLPLTRRLQALFRSRIGALPDRSRWLLLLIALDGTGDTRLLKAVGAPGQELDDLAAAEEARLAFLDRKTHSLTLRHPLIRSAVVELAPVTDRRAAHQALADTWAAQPDRRVWHLAHAAVGEDEEVAALLEDAAHRLLRRADGVGAASALVRAAELSPEGGDRARRLALAAYIGADVTGELGIASDLLRDARRIAPELSGSLEAAVAASYLLINGEGDVNTAHRLLVGAIAGHARLDEDCESVLEEALHTLTLVCFFGGRPELWKPLHEAVTHQGAHVPATLFLSSKMFADPVRTALPALPKLEAAIDGLADEVDPTQIVRIAIAAVFVDRIGGCREALWRVVNDGRHGGAVASAIQALILLARDDYLSGRWDEAQQLAGEAVELCETRGYQLFAWPGREVLASIAAARGEYEAAQALVDQMVQWAAPRGIGAVHAYASSVATLAALGQEDFEEAFRQASAVSPPGVLASHRPYATWVALDLVDAAVHTGRAGDAEAHVKVLSDLNISALSSRMALLAAGAAAIASPVGAGTDLFTRALSQPHSDRWQFDRARIELAYGERLRRAHKMVDARSHLSAALETFERLGASPWIHRAANALRATRQSRRPGDSDERDPLTPDELEIARLAAAGLTNKEIAARVFVSHRTAGTRLYRIFPKLGITSRAALRDALESRRDE